MKVPCLFHVYYSLDILFQKQYPLDCYYRDPRLSARRNLSTTRQSTSPPSKELNSHGFTASFNSLHQSLIRLSTCGPFRSSSPSSHPSTSPRQSLHFLAQPDSVSTPAEAVAAMSTLLPLLTISGLGHSVKASLNQTARSCSQSPE